MIGYDKAAELAKRTLKEERTLRELVLEEALVEAEELDRILDFRAMTELPVKISSVQHKTFLQVNEAGSEAAAVTSVEVVELSYPNSPLLDFDRPFFCAIVDKTAGAILFMGTVTDPQS